MKTTLLRQLRSYQAVLLTMTRPAILSIVFYCCSAIAPAFSQSGTSVNKGSETATVASDPLNLEKQKKPVEWKPLIAAETLEGWEKTNFGGEGEIEIKDGVMRIGRGDPLSGVTTTRKDFPLEDFEMQWKAMRVDGSDFFVGLTFPVGKEFCSLIAGGWGGGLVGLSSINGSDASENETSGFHEFKNGTWYSFRLRVDSTHITAWMDDKPLLKVERGESKFSLRGEVYKSRPLGYCTFQSLVDVKEWEYRELSK